LSSQQNSEYSNSIRERVIKARCIQSERFKSSHGLYANAQMRTSDVKKICTLNEGSQQLLKQAMERLNLSARAYDRIIKVSRTIADLDNSETIKTEHIAEAIQYRNLDREGWGS